VGHKIGFWGILLLAPGAFHFNVWDQLDIGAVSILILIITNKFDDYRCNEKNFVSAREV